MNKLSTYIILAIFSLVFDACYSPCRDYNFDDTFRNGYAEGYIPEVKDTLVFSSPTGQKFTFDKMVFVDRLILQTCDNCCSNNPDTTQERYIIYDSNLTSYKLKVMAFSDEYSDYLDVSYESKSSINLLYHNEDYYFTKSTKLSTVVNPSTSVIEHTDSITLNNTVFSNVYIYRQNIQTTKLFVSELYYSPAIGIVGYKLSDGVVWKLDN